MICFVGFNICIPNTHYFFTQLGLFEARDRVIQMYKNNQLDAATAMQMLSDPSIANVPAASGKGGDSKKRQCPEPVEDDGEQDLMDDIDKCDATLDAKLFFGKHTLWHNGFNLF